MTGIVLSASVRQNLLSLQNTAQLLATTQNDLSTGNKVNSALDNPTSYFTAAALTGRAGDISNLLDGIGNGVQVLQAANTGITSLQSLVASAQSVANQVLQTPVGYDVKSSVSTPPIAGANVNNLLGTGAGYTDATFAGATSTGTITAAFTSATSTGTAVNNDNSTPAPSARPPSWSVPPAPPRTTSPQARSPMAPRWSSTARPSLSRPRPRRPLRVRLPRPASPSVSAPAAPPRSQTILSDIDAITGGTGSTVVRRQARAADRHHRQPDHHRHRQRADRNSASARRHPGPRRRRHQHHGAGRHHAVVGNHRKRRRRAVARLQRRAIP